MGINLIDDTLPEEFEARFKYYLEVMSKTKRPAYFTTMFIHEASLCSDTPRGDRYAQFNKIIVKCCQNCDAPNIRLIDGRELLDDYTGLCYDLVHPTDEGHFIMGRNLARILRKE